MLLLSMRLLVLASLFLLVLLSTFVLVCFSSFGSAKEVAVGVSIGADGKVYGTSSIKRNGDIYTFVGNVSGPLYVERDKIVIDGAGYTLVGGNGRGVVLADRKGVTVKSVRVELDGGYTVDVESAVDCALIGNTLVGTQQLGPIGVNFLHSQGITVKDNTIVNSWRGLSLEWSSGHTITGNTFVDGIIGIEICCTTGCVFRDNHMINSSFSIRVYPTYQYGNDLDSSNTVNGKPIYYLIDAKDATVPSDAAYIVLVGCENMLIENASPQGIALISTNSSTISRVRMTGRGDGIDLLNCSGISIFNSVLLEQAIAIQLEGSNDNAICDNEISKHTTRGINLGDANNNLISGNIFSDNSYAIAPFQDALAAGNIVTSNKFTQNDYSITVGGNMEILGNMFEENKNALLLSGGSGSNITQNTFKKNEYALYISSSSYNNIYLNNFLNNDHQIIDAGVSASPASTQTVEEGSNLVDSVHLVAGQVSGAYFFPPPPPSTNNWDNGTKGNYWSDYTGTDANGDGIGDTPYVIYENNQDNYPLMKQFETSPAQPIAPVITPDTGTSPTSSSPEPKPEPLPMVTVVAASVAVIAVVTSLLVYSKKHKH